MPSDVCDRSYRVIRSSDNPDKGSTKTQRDKSYLARDGAINRRLATACLSSRERGCDGGTGMEKGNDGEFLGEGDLE